MRLHPTVREALPTPRQSWFGLFARVLAKLVGGRRTRRGSRWYDSDGVHRGL